MRSENKRLEMRQKEKFKMAKTTIKKKKVPGVSTIVADILAQEDQAIDLVSLLKASAASKCEQLAAIFAAIAEQIEASEDVEDLAAVVSTMAQVSSAGVYTETKKAINALKPHIPRAMFNGSDED